MLGTAFHLHNPHIAKNREAVKVGALGAILGATLIFSKQQNLPFIDPLSERTIYSLGSLCSALSLITAGAWLYCHQLPSDTREPNFDLSPSPLSRSASCRVLN